MATDPKHMSEEELNQQRKVQNEAEPDDPSIVNTLDRSFDAVVEPMMPDEASDDDKLQSEREAIDKETREA